MVVGAEVLVSQIVIPKPFAFAYTFMYTISATILHSEYEQYADDIGQGVPPESFPVPPRDGDEESPFRGDEAWAADRENESRKAQENTEATGRGIAPRSSGGARTGGSRRTVHDGGSPSASRPAPIALEWTPKAEETLRQLPNNFADRITEKMYWFAAQENPLRFAKRLRGPYGGLCRFRVGGYRVICRMTDGHFRVLQVLSVRNRKDVYRGIL